LAVVFLFAGAAGCVATLLHDAAMNPAEGNDCLTYAASSCCMSRLALYFWLAKKKKKPEHSLGGKLSHVT
jgi:hypothetical protein